jgi:mono/diheme cytochrome c family protein
MKKALLLVLMLPFAAHADKLRLPADTPPAFQAECASCHVAFPPQLMIADDWRRVMRSLDKHYGDNASLDEKTRLILEDFHIRHAGMTSKVGAGGTARTGEPPRLTQTDWFQREHRKVSAATWKDTKVKTPANCAACHTKAAEGSYREREIVMPDGRRWKD